MVMLTEAAVGAVVGELLRAVLEIKGKIEAYESILDHIESTLRQIEPIVNQIDDLNVKLEKRGEQTKLLWETIEKGKSLLNDCASETDDSSCFCSCFKKQHQNLKRLQDLDKSLASFFTIVMSLQTYREVIGGREAQDKTHSLMEKIGQSVDDIKKQLTEKNASDNAGDGDKSGRQQGDSQARPRSGYYSYGDETRSSVPNHVPDQMADP